MADLLIYLYGILTVLVIATLVFLGLKLKASAVRINRSLDPITQKSKTLKIEISALQRSRLERQRRLENTGSKGHNPKSKV
jgi:hypothetical protein